MKVNKERHSKLNKEIDITLLYDRVTWTTNNKNTAKFKQQKLNSYK